MFIFSLINILADRKKKRGEKEGEELGSKGPWKITHLIGMAIVKKSYFYFMGVTVISGK